jgi:hypothetical protein
MKNIYIGQIVEVTTEESRRIPNLPKVGKVVDIQYEYSYDALIGNKDTFDQQVNVIPVVHFLGENQPRGIHSSNIKPYKFKD